MRTTKGGGRPAPDVCRICLKPRNGQMGGLWLGAQWTCSECVENGHRNGKPISPNAAIGEKP